MSCSHTFLSQAVEAASGGGDPATGRGQPPGEAADRRDVQEAPPLDRVTSQRVRLPLSPAGHGVLRASFGLCAVPQRASGKDGRASVPQHVNPGARLPPPGDGLRGPAAPWRPVPVSLRFSRRAGRPFSSRDALLTTTPDPGTGEAQVPLQVTAAAPPHTQCPPHRTPQPPKSAGLHDPPQTTGRAARTGAATGRLWQ